MHLSPLGFAACQSKKCTNKAVKCTNKTVKCTNFLSVVNIPAWMVHLRQVHPLKVIPAWMVHLRQVHPLKVTLAQLVHFLLWQAAKPSGDKCTP